MTDASPKIIAVVGESQVGKSSLVNAVIGETLLPTAGVGRPRSQAVCECLLEDLPVSQDRTWHVEVDWLSTTELVNALSLPPTGPAPPRATLFHEGMDERAGRALAIALKNLRSVASADQIPSHLAMGRDVRWLRLHSPCTGAEARRQLDPLTGGWAAALTASVRVRGIPPHRYALVDLPGVGGYLDAGGEATRRWLGQHASSVSVIVCVIGSNGLGEALSGLLRDYWRPTDLLARLHVVTTYADRLVDDPESATQREAAAQARRARAAEQLGRLLGLSNETSALARRIYCIDPRTPGRWTVKVDFEGEIERLRQALRSATRPPKAIPIAAGTSETLRQWLDRVVTPFLLGPVWQTEHLRSRRERAHLVANDRLGRPTTVLTVYGTGEARATTMCLQFGPQPPLDEPSANQVRDAILGLARDLGVTIPTT